jgi:hypothetical protein
VLAIMISILAAIPVGIGVNLITPWVKTKLSTYSQTRREARIRSVQHEYLEIMTFRRGENTNRLVARIALRMVYLVSFFMFAVLSLVLSLYAVVQYEAQNYPSRLHLLSNGGPLLVFVVLAPLVTSIVTIAAASYVSLNVIKLLSNIFYASDRYKVATERTLRKLGSLLPEEKEPTEAKEQNSDKSVDLPNPAKLGEGDPKAAESS